MNNLDIHIHLEGLWLFYTTSLYLQPIKAQGTCTHFTEEKTEALSRERACPVSHTEPTCYSLVAPGRVIVTYTMFLINVLSNICKNKLTVVTTSGLSKSKRGKVRKDPSQVIGLSRNSTGVANTTAVLQA